MHLQTLKRIPELIGVIVFMTVGLGFFALTNPATLPPGALMVAFFVVYGLMYYVLKFLLRVTTIKNKLSSVMYRGVLIGGAALPVLLLALQSLGQLTSRDTVTLAILYIAGYFYLSRTASAHGKSNAQI